MKNFIKILPVLLLAFAFGRLFKYDFTFDFVSVISLFIAVPAIICLFIIERRQSVKSNS
ncbi:hypothetical protein [Elizabethkingia meningoseptica]|uniref:hypothetical protein n=1 Tax=Elizabethkingia meningoseptica TaxID=238 RepID=UPI002012F5AC|nr:hypothetical protein [Elizabethkingia meningoseptica]MCL1676043.1 hypothetical protein [Elizabethkingia meningoseptica]MCL1684753.1 hypothetical protein [Elizabethkingia meningoseptica]